MADGLSCGEIALRIFVSFLLINCVFSNSKYGSSSFDNYANRLGTVVIPRVD